MTMRVPSSRTWSIDLALDHATRPDSTGVILQLVPPIEAMRRRRRVGVGNDESPLGDTEVHYLRSSLVDDEFKIFVGHCPSDSSEPPGVVYVTDANGMFGATVDAIRGMQLVAQLPPLLVIGIGYRVGAIGETLALRQRDFTPSADCRFPPPDGQLPTMGGAAPFLDFLRHELAPWVASHYEIAPGDSTLFGHSLGGLFATWVMLTEPQAFRRYLIGSPSLWWDDDLIFRHEVAYAGTHQDLPATAFFGIGAQETLDGRIRESARLAPDLQKQVTALPLDMVDDLRRLVGRLESRNYPGLDARCVVLPDEFHVTVAPLILSRGLRHLYHAPR
jgi:predicted alpha/beta superfamily hydrolase